MNNHVNDPINTSRRDFTKSLATALIVTPLAVSSISGQHRGVTYTCKPSPLSPLLTKKPCPQLGTPHLEPHEPPIGVGGGSLTMECEEKMHHEGSGTGPRKHLYDFEKYTYGHMIRLEVLSEYASGLKCECYPLDDPKVIAPTLKIWLQRLKDLEKLEEDEYPWIEDDIDPKKTEPHIFMNYRIRQIPETADVLVIESDKRLGDVKKSFKAGETFKHKHKGYGSTRFRIGRWMIVNCNGDILAGDCAGPRLVPNVKEGEDPVLEDLLGFYLRPRFEHLSDTLRLKRERRPACPRDV